MEGNIIMNWFKIAKDFSTRNTINHKIIYLKELKNNMDYLSKVVFQSGTTAKNTTYKILTAKQITSYPLLKDMISEANITALDSPQRFSVICNNASVKIGEMIQGLVIERQQFTSEEEGEKKVVKGWF